MADIFDEIFNSEQPEVMPTMAPSSISGGDVFEQAAQESANLGQPVQLSGQEKLESYGARIVDTRPDGTQLLQLPNGHMHVLNEELGYSSSSPQVVEQIMQGQPLSKIIQMGESEQIMQAQPMAAVAAQYSENAPFIGSWIDEGAGAQGKLDRMAQAFRDVNPEAAAAVGISSAVINGALEAMPASRLLKGKQLYDAIMKLPNWKKYLSLGLTGAGITGAEAFVYGSGTGKDVEERLDNALGQAGFAAPIGAAANTIIPLAGTAIARGYQNIRSAMKNQGVSDIMKEFGISKDSAVILRDAFRDVDDLTVMLTNIRRAGEEGMIADADKAAAAVLDAAATADVAAGRIAGPAVERRAERAAGELKGVMDESIMPQQYTIGEQGESLYANANAYAKQIADSTRPAREEAYNKFYARRINYASDAGMNIERVLGRISPEMFQKVRAIAESEMRDNGIPKQIMADIADDGSIKFVQMPSAIELDYLKRAIGDIAFNKNIAQDALAAVEQRQARKLYSELNDAIGTASPLYRKATELGGDKISRERALELGTEVLSPKLDPKSFYDSYKAFNKGQQIYVRAGLRGEVERLMNTARASIATPEELTALRKTLAVFSDANTKTKMTTLLGREEAKQLNKELDKLRSALELRAELAVNSKTAQRGEIMGRIDEVTQPSVGELIAQVKPAAATQRLGQLATGATEEATAVKRSEILRDLARAMTEKKGEAAEKGLYKIYQSIRKQTASDADYQTAIDFMLGSVKLPAYLFGVESGIREIVNE